MIEKNSHSFGIPEVNNMMKKAKMISFKEKISKEVGIKTCDFEQMIYHADKKTYINESDVKPDDIGKKLEFL